MVAESLSGLWDFFDKVYCISVEEREDRRQEARRQFEAVGLSGRVEFLIVKKHPADPEQGIYESHLACFRRGIQAGAETLLLFEDDVVFERFSPAVLADCVRFLSGSDSWEMFFLGCLSAGSRRTENPAVLRVRYRCLTHAYAVRRGFAETLLAAPRGGLPYDGLLRSLSGAYYAAYPSFAFQSDAPTDNLRYRRLDRFRRLCGGLLRIQKMDEWVHRHKWAIVGVHLCLIALLAALIGRL
jgi:GR25 family glycosyltransferase involved in LPS biosynthesis